GAFGKTDLVGNLSIVPTIDQSYGRPSEYYPIKVTVTGKDNGRKFAKKTYTFHYNEDKGKYIQPKGYPILYN
ncbi:MAG: hypothetical protein IK089_04630, partial [Oxalobacter sp.]|nr:hypothetical protein [Oxalobacter sp.]